MRDNKEPAAARVRAAEAPVPTTAIVARTGVEGILSPGEGISPGSPLEEAGFELSVPRDKTKVSRPAHVAFA
jgi:hypothetical protein